LFQVAVVNIKYYLLLKKDQFKTETGSKNGGLFPIHEHRWALVKKMAEASNAVLLLKLRLSCKKN